MLVGLIVILVIGWFVWGRNGNGNGGEAEIKRGNVLQVVSVTGSTKSKNNVSLAFDISGRVTSISREVGQQVVAGSPIVSLDQSQAYANVMSAQAALDYQRARLGDAKVSLDDANNTVDNGVRDSFTAADNAVRNTADKFFIGPNSPSPIVNISFLDVGTNVSYDIIDSNLKLKISKDRKEVEMVINEWKDNLLKADYLIDKASALSDSKARMMKVRNLFDDLSLAINTLGTVDYKYQVTVAGYKNDIATARTAINNSISALSSVEQSWNTARLAVASSNKGQVSTQDAQIKQAEANLAQSQAALNKLTIFAPFSGLITKQDAKVGEIVQAGVPIVTLMSPDNFEIEVNVPEVDIGKIRNGQEVEVSFDAFPGEKFKGRVYYIEPAETLVDGVVNYKVKVALDNTGGKLKNGLTANLDIITATRTNVLTIPQYAVIENDNGYSVKKVVNGNVVDTPIKVGLRGRDGVLEVLSGLSEGDKVQNVGIKTK